MIHHNGYVQYGCGLCAPATWTNFDASPTLRIQRWPLIGHWLTRGGPQFPADVQFGDIIRGLPIAPESCAAIYCSHVLEHLSLEDLRIALRNTRNYLKPGGVFRFVLPDLEYCARAYLTSSAEQPAIVFMEDTMLGYPDRPRGLRGMLRSWLGNSRHLWMWDYKSLSVELKQAGFESIRRAQYGDSPDPRFADVEDPGRWEHSLGMECCAPGSAGP